MNKEAFAKRALNDKEFLDAFGAVLNGINRYTIAILYYGYLVGKGAKIYEGTIN